MINNGYRTKREVEDNVQIWTFRRARLAIEQESPGSRGMHWTMAIYMTSSQARRLRKYLRQG